MNDDKYIQRPTPEQRAALDAFVRTLPRLPNPFDGRDARSGFDHEAAERRAMVLAIKLHHDEVMHFRTCADCVEPNPLCPRGQELSQAAWMAHETVMDFILGEPTKEDIEHAAQALRDAFTKVNPA